MRLLISVFFFSIFAFQVNAQDAVIKPKKGIDTASFEVTGICGMCKDRIENGAYIKGVKKVTWDQDAQELTVIYKPRKVTIKEVAKSVAEAGHDNEYYKASKENYDKIHNCCKYRELDPH